jgi:enterochelin esterase family protein
VKADKTVTFRLRAPKAVEVVLNGEWKGGGKLAMMKDEQGVWSITVGPLEPDLYGYSFSVDGMTVTDPVNSVLKPMRSPRTSVVDVPGDPPRLHDYQDVPRGTVRLHEYASKALGRRRPLRVYTPPATTRSRPRRGRCSISSTARATTRRPGRRSAART